LGFDTTTLLAVEVVLLFDVAKPYAAPPVNAVNASARVVVHDTFGRACVATLCRKNLGLKTTVRMAGRRRLHLDANMMIAETRAP
jgi:predicted membrane protein